MRTELEKIELIEKYLLKQLDAEELQQMEWEMEKDPAFKKEVEQQKQLMDGIKKQAFKDASSKAYKKYQFTKKLWQWGIGGALTVLAVGVIFLLTNPSDKTETPKAQEIVIPQSTIIVDSLSIDSTPLNTQYFRIDASKDTVIETKDGILMAIPANGFTDDKAQIVSGKINLVIKEALSPDEIISAGLSTTSNGELLETGGMFYINAFANNQELKIKKAIYVQVPTTELKSDMMLYDGVKGKNGQINWVNPKPLETWLTPVDILSLNFYPPSYEKTLIEMGFGNKDKNWKDSVYYSFAHNVKYSSVLISDAKGDSSVTITDKNGNTRLYIASSRTKASSEKTSREINPTKIQAIWNSTFNNTLLATREFEERLKVIFTTCENDILDLYVDNINKNLWEIDLLAAKKLSGDLKEQFLNFAKRKDGKVKMDDSQISALSRYYRTKTTEYQNNVKEANEAFWKDQNRLSNEFSKAASQKNINDFNRNSKNFNTELNKNRNEIYNRLGIKKSPFSRKYYTASVARIGWCNIDRTTLIATKNRTTTSFSYQGKTTSLNYNTFTVEVKNKIKYDRIHCYLLPRDLYSFQRMNDVEGGFSESLNEFISYNLAVVAYKGDSIFFFQRQELPKAGGKTIASFSSISQKELNNALNMLGQQQIEKDILEDLDFEVLKARNDKRKKEVEKMEDMREQLERVVFPCAAFPADSASTFDLM